MNTTLLRVLLVEDSEDDALLTLLELRKGGFQTEWERVDTRVAMEQALASRPWELVICDHVMPGFSSAGALDVIRKGALDLPFIIVSGVAPEDLVTAAMRQGRTTSSPRATWCGWCRRSSANSRRPRCAGTASRSPPGWWRARRA